MTQVSIRHLKPMFKEAVVKVGFENNRPAQYDLAFRILEKYDAEFIELQEDVIDLTYQLDMEIGNVTWVELELEEKINKQDEIVNKMLS